MARSMTVIALRGRKLHQTAYCGDSAALEEQETEDWWERREKEERTFALLKVFDADGSFSMGKCGNFNVQSSSDPSKLLGWHLILPLRQEVSRTRDEDHNAVMPVCLFRDVFASET